MLSLAIPRGILDMMIEQAKSEAPIEACGILAGRAGAVVRLYKMANIDRSATHFMMEPAEQFKVAKDVRAAGLDILAVYHSHCHTPARLSQEDIRLALTPNIAYVILSLQDPDSPIVKGFKIEDQRGAEIEICVTDTVLESN